MITRRSTQSGDIHQGALCLLLESCQTTKQVTENGTFDRNFLCPEYNLELSQNLTRGMLLLTKVKHP